MPRRAIETQARCGDPLGTRSPLNGPRRGDQVLIEARIPTVADIFDALTSRRVHKTPWSVEDMIAKLDRMAAEGKLDRAGVQATASCAEQGCEIMARSGEP